MDKGRAGWLWNMRTCVLTTPVTFPIHGHSPSSVRADDQVEFWESSDAMNGVHPF